MRPKAIDAILATDRRYAGAAVIDEDTHGLCDPFPNAQMKNVLKDAKLNAAKAIVAGRLVEALKLYANQDEWSKRKRQKSVAVAVQQR